MAIYTSAPYNLDAKLRCTREAPATNSYTVRVPAGALLTTADTLKFIVVPAGYRILEASIITGDLDTNGTPTLTLNFGYLEPGGTNDPDAFLAASTLGRTGGVVRVENGGDDPFAVGVLAAGTLDREIVIAPAANAATANAAAVDVTVVLTVIKDSFGADANAPYVYRDRYGSDSNSAN